MNDCTIVGHLADLASLSPRIACVYADPPWLYNNQASRAATSNHYPGLMIAEICALPVRDIVADDAVLFLWVTDSFLFEAPAVMKAWGFRCSGETFVWVKGVIGLGNYWRHAHELMMVGRRGKPQVLDNTQPSWMVVRRRSHSSKPEQVRHMIERISPGPYLEMFGRRAEAPGWYIWGHINPTLLSQPTRRL
jgi:N6-adenosine-specific RNA methylase IME4